MYVLNDTAKSLLVVGSYDLDITLSVYLESELQMSAGSGYICSTLCYLDAPQLYHYPLLTFGIFIPIAYLAHRDVLWPVYW